MSYPKGGIQGINLLTGEWELKLEGRDAQGSCPSTWLRQVVAPGFSEKLEPTYEAEEARLEIALPPGCDRVH